MSGRCARGPCPGRAEGRVKLAADRAESRSRNPQFPQVSTSFPQFHESWLRLLGSYRSYIQHSHSLSRSLSLDPLLVAASVPAMTIWISHSGPVPLWQLWSALHSGMHGALSPAGTSMRFCVTAGGPLRLLTLSWVTSKAPPRKRATRRRRRRYTGSVGIGLRDREYTFNSTRFEGTLCSLTTYGSLSQGF